MKGLRPAATKGQESQRQLWSAALKTYGLTFAYRMNGSETSDVNLNYGLLEIPARGKANLRVTEAPTACRETDVRLPARGCVACLPVASLTSD